MFKVLRMYLHWAIKSKLRLEIKKEIKVRLNHQQKEKLVQVMSNLFKFSINTVLKKILICLIFKITNKTIKIVWSTLKIQIFKILIWKAKMRWSKINILKASNIKNYNKIYRQLIAKTQMLIQLPKLDLWKKILFNPLQMALVNNLAWRNKKAIVLHQTLALFKFLRKIIIFKMNNFC